MGESQCAHCGHVVTGFEQVEFEQRAAESAILRQENETLKRELADVRARMERKDAALDALANAADDVGVRFFDTDTMEPEVEAMQSATRIARAALQEGTG